MSLKIGTHSVHVFVLSIVMCSLLKIVSVLCASDCGKTTSQVFVVIYLVLCVRYSSFFTVNLIDVFNTMTSSTKNTCEVVNTDLWLLLHLLDQGLSNLVMLPVLTP